MDRFYAIIFIAGRIRNGSFPRVPGFSYNEEHQKYLYQGRPLTLDEFNQAAETVLDPSEKRHSISVRLIDSPELLAQQAQEEAPAAEKAAAEKAAGDAPKTEPTGKTAKQPPTP